MGDYRIALRNDDDDRLDDVVVRDVSMFRAEIMSNKELWLCCYFPDSDQRIAFWVRVEKGKLRYYVTEQPPESEHFVYEDSAAEKERARAELAALIDARRVRGSDA